MINRQLFGPVRNGFALALFCLAPLVQAAGTDALAALGQALFHDPNLSLERTQSCASCHSPQRAFTDGRHDLAGGAVSLGADGTSAGRRNAPTLTYAALNPSFGQDAEGFVGGQFYDGRATTLLEQVTGPLHDAAEMAMPDAAAVARRLRERADYVSALGSLFPTLDPAQDEALYRSALLAIVAFERSQSFSSFDSKYDRFLAGEYQMTAEEAIGRELFFSDLANCRTCHLKDAERRAAGETFSSYRYYNIGVPANAALAAEQADLGLGENPQAGDDPQQHGRFRVPTLRNVAVTAPYMHNGVFQDLETAVRFYGRYIVANDFSETNPETSEAWGAPEVAENIELERLAGGQPIGPIRVRQLTAFLRTLTDRRYEHLLDPE
ncbi:MAG: cytochrome c peroxidase [Pseudomonadota bacterium]